MSPSVSIRLVQRADAAAMTRFVEGLGAASRRLRFHGAIAGCSSHLQRHLTEACGLRHVAYVARVGDAIVGEARYVLDAAGDGEFALAVGDAWQGEGVAAALMQRLLAHAAGAGVPRLWGDVLDDNARMAAFMRRQGCTVVIDDLMASPRGCVRWECRPGARPGRPAWRALRLPSLGALLARAVHVG